MVGYLFIPHEDLDVPPFHKDVRVIVANNAKCNVGAFKRHVAMQQLVLSREVREEEPMARSRG